MRRIPMSNIQLVQESTSIWAIVKDDLTATTVPALQDALKTALNKDAHDIVFDFQQLRSIDSSGIGLLLAAKNSMVTRQGSLRLINVPADIFSLFETMRLVDSLNAELASNDSDADLEQCFELAQTV
ncbi:STAS domain-containing protein [Halochromatium sp.]|uniref:STAS domain-containing protein n=1 Tax=Halochromatium sp. TaxID=2049430 RepID=UPI00397A2C9A